jgi:hypothetical protein
VLATAIEVLEDLRYFGLLLVFVGISLLICLFGFPDSVGKLIRENYTVILEYVMVRFTWLFALLCFGFAHMSFIKSHRIRALYM